MLRNLCVTILAQLLGYPGDPKRMLEALLEARFADSDPLRIHDWQEYNGYHAMYSARAKKAAEARWQKERSKEKGNDTEKTGDEKSEALLGASDPQGGQKDTPRPMLGKKFKTAAIDLSSL